MMGGLTFIFWTSILSFSFPLLVGVHLSKSELEKVVNFSHKEKELRFRRQLIIDPQPFLPPVTNRILNVPIPTNIGFFPGGGQAARDQCERDEVLMEDGSCQSLLTPGNCNAQEEEVLIDPQSSRGFCARRICPPDRVFISATQLCHDPRDTSVCPPGRELYYSAFGTAVCMCPDGSIEGDDDLDDDVCEPVLGKSLQCLPGQVDYSSDYGSSSSSSYYSSRSYRSYHIQQVFWLKDFNSPPQCLPDPCNGANLNRGPDDLPFVPNKYGKCFQLGQTIGACPYGQIYILNLEQVRGECTTLEDAGYNIFDDKTLQALKKMFGPTITPNTAPAIHTMSYGNKTQTGTGMYGTSAPVTGINTNTIHPISSYQTHTSNTITPIKSTQHQSNLISTTNNFHTRPYQQPNNNIDQTNQIQQTHHQVVIGANGFTSSKKTKPYSPSSINNLGQGGISPSQQYPSSQHHHQNTIPNTQKPFISHSPINHINSQIPFNPPSRPTINPIINNVTPNLNPLIGHTNQKPISQSSGVNQGKEICTFIQNPNGHGGKKVCQPVHPAPSHGANKGKEICTFVQNPNGQGGKKVCQTIQPGPFNSLEVQGQGGQFNSPEFFGQPSPLSFEAANGGRRGREFESYGFRLGKSFGFQNPPQPGLLTHHVTVHPSGQIITHLRPVSRHGRSAANEPGMKNNSGNQILSRKRRNVLPHASPTNVFETRLLSCRPGAARDLNGKCRTKVLPARIPTRRGVRAAPPVPPTPSCPRGMAFNIRRMCVPATVAQNSLIALNLG